MPTPHASRRSGRQFRQKRMLLVLAVLVGTGLAAYAGHQVQVNRQAPALLERGRAASAEQSWKPAIDAYTQYLKLRPRDATAHVERADAYAATRRYKDLSAKVGRYVSGFQATDLDAYVTERALSGLFTTLADEEKKIRENPAARTSELLKKVFGRY